MQARLAASKTVTHELMRKTAEVQTRSRTLQLQQEVAERWRDRLTLTEEEVSSDSWRLEIVTLIARAGNEPSLRLRFKTLFFFASASLFHVHVSLLVLISIFIQHTMNCSSVS